MQQKSSRGVQQHEVTAAADALLAERARPTVERVRAKIGRGSPNTVAPMLETWFAELAPRLGLGPQVERAGVPAPVRQAMEMVWVTARDAADTAAQEALAGDRQQLAQDEAALATERAELARQAEAQGVREALLVDKADGLARQVADLTQRLAEAADALQFRDLALEEARDSIATLVQQKDSDARSHAKALDGLAKERDRLEERSAARERRLLEDVDRARQEAKISAKALADTESRFAKERLEAERSLQAIRKTMQALEVEKVALQERLAGADQRLRDFQALVRPATKPPTSRRRQAKAV